MNKTLNVSRRICTLAILAALAIGAGPAFAAEPASGVVNLNTATAEQLALLPGVGPAVAARIVAHREEHGAFRKTEQLMLVRGVGEKTFETLRPHLVLEGKTTLAEKVRVPRTKPDANKG